ncbi:hypothetical protein B0H13DRAFT_2377061 [Mycena leptocephala]|nr:hypothetical protein B0H13DRAFT_2377061 [Mycena leptocephala]
MSVASLNVTADEGQDPRDEISVATSPRAAHFETRKKTTAPAFTVPTTPRCARLPAHPGIDRPCWVRPAVTSPSPLAQYEHPPIVGSRAPTPTYQPDTPPPLFLPCSDDETDNEAPLSRNAADAPPAHPRPRPPSPPRKRRRVHKSTNNEKILAHVKRFVDLEAQETDVEEDDETDADMVGFIDDDPVDDEPVHHPEDVHRERWRRVPESHRRRREQREIEAHELENEAKRYEDMARQARVSDPELEGEGSVPATIARLPHPGNCPIYRLSVPTRSEYLLIHFLLRCKGLRSAFTRGDGSGSVYVETSPIELTPEERVPALSFPSFQSPVGRWARVIAGTQLYKNDIVFVMDDSEYLAIPRVPYAKVLDTHSAPDPELFDPARFQTVHPGDQLVKRNMFWLWGKERRFQSGLEHRAWKPSYTTLENAVPSDRQRALFAQSGHRALQATPFTGRTGFIVVLAEMKQKDAQTKRDRLVRVAAVLERYNGTDAISKKSLESKENPCFAVAIQCLRLHILSTPRRFPLTIELPSSPELLEVPPDESNLSAMTVCRDETLRRDFRVCDVVEIIRGPKQGTAGFVVEVHTGGFVVFYPCTIPRMFNAMSDGYSFNREAIQPIPPTWSRVLHLPSPTPTSNLFPSTPKDLAKPPAEFYASPTMQTAAQNRALYDELHTKWELDRMHTGKWFEGMGFDSMPYFERKTRGQLPEITLRIQQDASLAEFDAKLDQLWDRYTNLPLQQALYFRKLGPINLWKKAEPVAEPVVEPVSWPEVCVVPEPAPTKFGFASLLTTGGWLLQPEFVNKRIDVKVVDVKACLNTHLRKINTKTFAAEGKFAWSDVPPDDDPAGRHQAPSTDAVGRVIIIGPDVYGSRQRVGQYAETIPASIQHGSPVVEVRFPLESGGRPPNGTYHLECLCRSRNVALDAWNIPATDFDAPFDPVWAQEGWTKSAKTTKGK